MNLPRIVLLLLLFPSEVCSRAHYPSPITLGIRSALARRSRRSTKRFYVSSLKNRETSEFFVDKTRTAFLRIPDQSAIQEDEASVLLGDDPTGRHGQQGPLIAPFMNNGKRQRTLNFVETMICGAVSRSIAQTFMHPFNTMKTILQNERSSRLVQLVQPRNWSMLTRGAGAQAILSVPHGAVNFAVIEFVRARLGSLVFHSRWSPGLDFASSCIATITCSAVSTPQMMICDNIMAGNYPNLVAAVRGLAGKGGFYAGWWPGLVGKIPSYALTWTLFQQLKRVHQTIVDDRPAEDWEHTAMGCLASAISVCAMIPMDTIKTRLVTQTGRAATEKLYKGIVDCAVKTFQKEGIGAFYRGLPPRLVSVVPMIGIQFGVYEAMKKVMLQRQADKASTEGRFQ